jgi:hypothetical protein
MATRFVPPAPEQLRQWITTGEMCTTHRVNVYPPEAIEPTMKILGYLHRRCADNLNTLVEHVRRRGYNESYNYFYQLLTGRYFNASAAGGSGGSWRKVAELWQQLEVWDRFMTKLASVKFIETSVWRRINAYVQRKRAPHTCCRFGAIRGRTGNQKTECYLEIIRREPEGMGWHMESPDSCDRRQFIYKLAFIMGAKKRSSIAQCCEFIRERLILPDRFVFVDNVQRCYNPRTGAKQPIFDFMQMMQEDTRSTWFISWTPVEGVFNEAIQNDYFEQFIGRIGGEREILEIEDYPVDEDVEMIAASFGLPERDVEELMPRLRSLVREKGRVRALFNALQMASRTAHANKETFRATHVTRYLAA